MRVGEHVRQRGRVRRRRSRLPSMSTGFATLASAGSTRARAATVSSPSAGSSRPAASHASAQRMPETAGVRHDPHRAPVEPAAGREQRGDVDQLLERLRADDAGLAEQRIGGRIGAGERGRVRARCALAALRAAALEREDRLAARDPARDARRTGAGSRTTRRRAGSPRSRRRPPTTRAGRSWRRPPCSRSRRTRRGRGRA